MSALLFAASSALRIASLDLCADEYALLLAPERTVSVSHLGKSAQDNVWAARAASISANDGTVESALARRPDLLLTSRALPSGAQRLAQRLDIEIVTLPYPDSPMAVARQVERLGARLDASTRARRWKIRFQRLRRPASRENALWVGPGGTEVGTLGAGWLALAGIAPLSLGPGAGKVEQIVRARPALIIESTYQQGRYHRGGAWRTHPLVSQMDVPRIAVDGRAFTCAGPAMLAPIERLRERLR